ncbi:MAG: hypothetical protein FDZ70_02640 [Actinobacteria bacterium]|nr:MAG: hypothetical protein FDZ70_02640 [Actinomycetota bacterium]
MTGSAGAIAGAAATGTAAASFTRAAKVAYRKDGWLWVAGEDGTGAKKVAQAAAGSFALAPDGATLAYEDSVRSLRLAPVAGGAAKNAGPMVAGSPIAWAPSSAWLAYAAPTGVRRVDRDGSAGAPLIAGVAPAVSADGVRVGVVQARAGLPDALAFADSKGGPVGAVTGAEHPETFAWLDARRVAVVVRGLSVQGGTEYSIGVAEVPGGALTAVTTHEAEARAVPTAMCASPDGRHIAWADQGDDGWSRTYLLDTQGGSPVLASKRYDTYPLCWSANGKRLFVIEGNAWQGQATRLVSLSADATDKRVIVEGAGL